LRRRYYLPITVVALAGAVDAFFAQKTGGSLRRALREAGKRVGNHSQEGNVAFCSTLLLAGACVVLYVYENYGEQVRARLGMNDRYRLPFDENLALDLMALPIALLALAMMILAGHSGATLAWKTAGSVTPTVGQ